jgi:Ca-activated chloride channel homolog
MIPLFLQTRWIVAVLILLLVLLALAAFVARRRRVARILGDPVLVTRMVGEDLGRIPWIRMGIVFVAATAIALAILDPRAAAGAQPRGGPVVLLLDASGSMLVHDTGAPRLEVQREIAHALVRDFADTPIGIVAFAGRAFSLTPPTLDTGALRMYLDAVDPHIVTQTGSALGAAIRQGVGLLALGPGGGVGGKLILFSDGDETEDRSGVLDAADLARRAGTRVHVVGIGTPEGGPVPALDLTTGRADGFLRQPGGQPVLSRLDADLLQEVARRTGGLYVSASEPEGLSMLRQAIGTAPVDPVPAGIPPYVLFAVTALLLLFAEPLAARRRGKGRGE